MPRWKTFTEYESLRTDLCDSDDEDLYKVHSSDDISPFQRQTLSLTTPYSGKNSITFNWEVLPEYPS